MVSSNTSSPLSTPPSSPQPPPSFLAAAPPPPSSAFTFSVPAPKPAAIPTTTAPATTAASTPPPTPTPTPKTTAGQAAAAPASVVQSATNESWEEMDWELTEYYLLDFMDWEPLPKLPPGLYDLDEERKNRQLDERNDAQLAAILNDDDDGDIL